jgi:glycosyltransferase involved in cell wall biosynthesis
MKIAVGILTYNRTDLLERLLKFMLPESDLLELIYIVDNGQQNLPYLEHPKIKVQKNLENLGCCGGWNQIIEEAIYVNDCDWVLILNDDIVLAPGQLKTIIDLLPLCKEKWFLTPDWEWACIAMSKAGADNLQYANHKWFDEDFWPGYFGDNDFHRRIILGGNQDKHIQFIPELNPMIKDKSKTGEREPALLKMHSINTERYIHKWGGPPTQETFATPYNKKLKPENTPILGFWHLAKLGYWEEIAELQLQRLKDSGLYDATDIIHVNMVGVDSCEEFPEFIKSDPKFKLSFGTKLDDYEFPTLEILQNTVENMEANVWYIHVKGASNCAGDYNSPVWLWREYLEYFVIDKWKDNITALEEGFDISGAEWRDNTTVQAHAPHFSGNFWWASSKYIQTLPKVKDIWTKDYRLNSEFWIGMSSPKYKCLHNFQQVMYGYRALPEDYKEIVPKQVSISGKLGDLIHCMQGLHHLHKEHGFVFDVLLHEGEWEPSLEVAFKDVYSLLKQQDYINGIRIVKQLPESLYLNMDSFRKYVGHSWTQRVEFLFNETFPVPYEAFIKVVPNPDFEDKIIIHETLKDDRMCAFPWQQLIDRFKGKIYFLSPSIAQYEQFAFADQVEFYQTTSILHYAECLAGCKGFIGNASLPLAIAHALDTPRLAELSKVTLPSYHLEGMFSPNFSFYCDENTNTKRKFLHD